MGLRRPSITLRAPSMAFRALRMELDVRRMELPSFIDGAPKAIDHTPGSIDGFPSLADGAQCETDGSAQCVPFSPRGGEKVPGGRMRGGRDDRARGMLRRGRFWQQDGRVVHRLSVRRSPAFGTLSPHAGRGNICAGNDLLRVRKRKRPLAGPFRHVVGFYFAGAAAGAPAFLAKSPARNTLSASGFRCLRIAAFTWSTVSAAYFASRSAVNCMVRP